MEGGRSKGDKNARVCNQKSWIRDSTRLNDDLFCNGLVDVGRVGWELVEGWEREEWA